MKLTYKQKVILKYVGVAGGVYLIFRYLLPLVLPFLFAYGIACLISPITDWMKQAWHIPIGVAAGLLLLLFGGSILLLVFFLGRRLLEQLLSFTEHLPEYVESVSGWLEQFFCNIEKIFHLQDGVVWEHASEMVLQGFESIKEGAVLQLASRGMDLFSWFMRGTTVMFVVIIAVILCVNELKHIQWLRDYSLFAREIAFVRKPLAKVGKAYLRTQAIILSVIMSILILGLTLMGNPYAVLLGILIGILDALPLFGTGTVLIPWTLINILLGRFYRAAGIATLYVTCYFTREFLDTRLMGAKTGMTPLETMIAIYVGLRLFSLWGLFLGPIGWMLVKEACRPSKKKVLELPENSAENMYEKT